MTEEVRIVDPVTGGEKGRKLERFDLIPVGPLTEVARLYGVGAAKYAERNWERGLAWSLSYAALMRHATQFWDGESVDTETQRHHLASVIFHAMALMEFEAKGKGTDDRPKDIESLTAAAVRMMRQHDMGFVSRDTFLHPLGATSEPLIDTILPPEIDSPYDVTQEDDDLPLSHRHFAGDHDADQPSRDHIGCVPCSYPKCNCHHPYPPG